MADAQTPSPESLQLELQEAIATFRHQWSQLMQALGVIVTANLALSSYGFAHKLSGVLFAASLMPLVALSAYTTIMTSLVPICYVAIRLEEKLSLHDAPLIGTWVKLRGDLPVAISNFARRADSEAPDSTLRVPAGYFRKNLTGLGIISIFVLQIILAVISIFVFHFSFF
jgi:hypothetical protein